MLVNCTAVGLDGSDPFDRLPIGADDLGGYGCVVDLVYTVAGTALVARARERGIPTVDGLELLVGQGALSFELFTGCRAAAGGDARRCTRSVARQLTSARHGRRGVRRPRTTCHPCRGTGRLISGPGRQPHEVACPWCRGTGKRIPGIDAQEHPAEGGSAA